VREDRPQRQHLDVLAELLGPVEGRRVADIGCGQGGLARRLAGWGAQVLGLEPQPAALNTARAYDAEEAVAWIAAGGEALPLADGCLDAALYFNALHHVPVTQIDRALAEAQRALAAGGLLLAVEPLAEGAVFELVRDIEDETAVRAAADGALARAPEHGGWQCTARIDYLAPVRHANFESFRDHIVAVDPARRPAVEAAAPALRRRFHELAQRGDDAYWFDQPSRATLLTRLA
jgi:SAM-dependent methyltransferase